MEMGLGKSKVIIDTIGKLKLEGEIDAAMIVAPKGVYDNWVKQEIPNHLPDEFERFRGPLATVQVQSFPRRYEQSCV